MNYWYIQKPEWIPRELCGVKQLNPKSYKHCMTIYIILEVTKLCKERTDYTLSEVGGNGNGRDVGMIIKVQLKKSLWW